MSSFTDKNGQRWPLAITVASARRVMTATGVNLLQLVDKTEELQRLAEDAFKFGDVLYELVRPVAEQQDVSPEKFFDGFDAETIDQATAAFVDAIVDFFPTARKVMLRKVADRAKQAMTIRDQALEQMIADGTLDRKLEQAMAATSGDASGKSPAGPESTPTR